MAARSGIPPIPSDLVRRLHAAALRLRSSRRAVAFTGAGLSVESGIPGFQPGLTAGAALWEEYDPAEYGTIDAFARDPAGVWRMLREVGLTLMAARPNPGHAALATLESMGLLAATITQNVDGLHQAAGSVRVIELHGNWRTLRCASCGAGLRSETVSLSRLPPVCPCGGVLRPDVTLFGEIIPMPILDAAREEARTCDCMLVVGTSASVYPAASIPLAARAGGAFIIEVNVRARPGDGEEPDLLLQGSAGAVLPELVKAIRIGPEQ